MLALRDKIAKEKQEKEKQELIDKHGEEGYAKLKQEEEEHKKAKAAAKKAELQAKEDKRKLIKDIMILLSLTDGDTLAVEGATMAKSAAKMEWALSDLDFLALTPESMNGNRKRYLVTDLIRVAKKRKHTMIPLHDKIQNKPDVRKYYAGYLKSNLDEVMAKLRQESSGGSHARGQVQPD